ncbi:unnamed protein product [Malus baccata var. baccata]
MYKRSNNWATDLPKTCKPTTNSLVQAILDSTIKPATPQNLLRDIAVSSTTVLSSTSAPDTSAQSFKRNRESVRRCLFAVLNKGRSSVNNFFFFLAICKL